MKSYFVVSGKLRKKGLLSIVCLCLFTLICYHFVEFSPLLDDYHWDFSEIGFGASDYFVRRDLHYSSYKYSLTEKFEKTIGGWDSFSKKPHDEKCRQFFKFLDENHPDWEVPQFYDNLYDKHAVAKGRYFEDAYHTVKKRKKKDKDPEPDVITEEDRIEINGWFQDRVNLTKLIETEMADIMTVVRSYGHCFFSGGDPDKDLQGKYARKLTPFFHDQLPTFEPPDNTFVEDLFPGKPKYMPDDTLVQYYYEHIEGKGIVISAATRYSKDISRLIRVLRALNNKLPIQIVYRGDLLMRSKKMLQGAAVAPIDEILGEIFTDKKILTTVMPEVDLHDPAKYGSEFPIQHLTFVNIERPMKLIGKQFFSGYNNKILALMFNTFKEVILVDADAVPLELPQSMFDSPEYKETGAFFFRDRLLRDSNDWIETNYFSKLMPHSHSSLDIALGIKPVTEHTMDAPYMRGWRHTQEAGIVLFNRKKHYAANLAILPLALWGEPVKSSIWGDKEMYWLAMSIVGDENYSWSKYDAASVGELTTDPQRRMYNGSVSSEVCLSHPGHMSSSGKILWINSGFSFCKKNGYGRDERKFPFSAIGNKEILKAMYQEPLRIKNALVPPAIPPLRPRGSPIDLTEEVNYKLELKNRKKDVDELDGVNQIDSYEPQKGWVKSRCCTDYYYCAYNAIESYNNTGKVDSSGTVFTFNEEDRARYDYLGKMWISGIKTMQKLDVQMPPLDAYQSYEGSPHSPGVAHVEIQRIDS